MSKISTVYDEVLSVLGNLYPDKTRLTNAYDLDDNVDPLLRDGYGLKVGTGTPVDSEFKNFSVDRSFSVVLTREVVRTEDNSTAVDSDVKALLEDVVTGQKDFYNVDQIDIPNSIEKIDLGPISAVEYFKNDRSNFISMEYELIIQVTENL